MSLDKLSEKDLNEKFENFLFNMSDYLEQIKVKANRQNFIFDYSIENLNQVETYLIDNNTPVDSDDYNDISTYLGEVVRINYGGKWICCLDKENNSLYYGFPVIEGHAKVKNLLFSPFHIVRSFILNHKNNLFINAIESQVNPQKIDWSKFPTEPSV
ncbi:MAG: hypothetical protein LBV32_07170 [Tannerellaceae bacterium]|jgi:hypothetical protein|nr:hypothetical protein [Tannerellaceae bacterium]